MKSLAAALGAAIVAMTLTLGVQGQPAGADVENSLTFFKMTETDQIINIAQYLAGNDDITRQLIKIAESLTWLVDDTNGNPLGDAILPGVLDALPGVFSSDYFKGAVRLSMFEISQVPVNDTVMNDLVEKAINLTKENRTQIPIWGGQFNHTVGQLRLQYMISHANWFRALNNYVAGVSARSILYEVDPSKTTVTPQCYADTTDFMDAVIGYRSQAGFPNVDHYMWALQMFDSFGKVSGGLMKGSLYYPGSFDECQTIHAHIPQNASVLLGNRSHDYVTDFDTRFCRATFDLPAGLTESFNVDTKGIPLRLHWGMCMPASCHSDDVEAMFRMGMLNQMNLPVHSVFCTEKPDFKHDAGAIVASVIIGVLVLTVVLCTLYEAAVVFYNNNLAVPSRASSIEDPQAYCDAEPITKVYENQAYEGDGKNEHDYSEINDGKLEPPVLASISEKEKIEAKSGGDGGIVAIGYVKHREAPPVFKDNLPAKPPSSSEQRPAVKRDSPPPSYTRNVNDKQCPKVVKAFSLLTNMPKVLSGHKSPAAIHCLHGIRFFSLCWVILGHTYNYGVISVIENPTTVNLLDASFIFQRFTFQGVAAGGFAVDTFFLLSGLLVTWLALRDIKKKNSVGYWVMFYVHRFWRLTPLYMIVLMVFSCLHTYMGDGPLWPENLETATNCKKYWWTNLLYVNNLVKVDDMCLGWTWYLANDMQFYWISPFFLLPLAYFAPLGVLMTFGLLCAGIAAAVVMEYRNGGDVFSMHQDGSEYWDEVYITPWCRVAAYAVGMLLGYTFHKFKRRTLNMRVTVLGWVTTWVVGVTLCYITFTKRQEGGTEWVRWFESIYEAVGRPLWAACVGWIIFACHNNRGGFINSILSWAGFLPLSRLTYAAYLIHPIVMMIHVYSKRALIYISDFDMAYLFMGHFVTSFLAAFVFSVCAEAPALALEKLMFRLR